MAINIAMGWKKVITSKKKQNIVKLMIEEDTMLEIEENIE